MHSLQYVRLIKRIRAVLIDGVLIPVVALGTLIIGDSLGVTGVAAKMALIVCPIFILEPAMLSLTGGTVGHHLVGIKVTQKDGVKYINIFAAVIRFLVKILLGWLSFIFVFTTRKHQAVHDLIAGSIVTHRNGSEQPQYDALNERTIEEEGYRYPAAWRKSLVVVAYCLLITALISFMAALALSTGCLESHRCNSIDRTIELLANVLWLFAIGATIVFGWKSRLYGCRRTPRKPDCA